MEYEECGEAALIKTPHNHINFPYFSHSLARLFPSLREIREGFMIAINFIQLQQQMQIKNNLWVVFMKTEGIEL